MAPARRARLERRARSRETGTDETGSGETELDDTESDQTESDYTGFDADGPTSQRVSRRDQSASVGVTLNELAAPVLILNLRARGDSAPAPPV